MVHPAPDLFTQRPDVDHDAFDLPPLTGAAPDAVLIGLSSLASSAPLWGSAIEWRELVDGLRAWTCRWHGPATAAGWTTTQLFGLSAHARQVRREMMGGAWLATLHGDRQTTSVDPTAIKITTRTAARLSIYRPAPGGVLAWSLCGTAANRPQSEFRS